MANQKKWSRDMADKDGEPGQGRDIFANDDPKAIAAALKRSAEASTSRRAGPFRSAMSMLTFHINRAGGDLDAHQRQVLEQAKDELRTLFGKPRKEG